MKLGIQIPSFTYPGGNDALGSTLEDIVTTIDHGGFDSLWVMDHYFQIEHVGEYDEPMLEGYSALNYFAGLTSQVTLGTLVTGVIYRNPAFLIKQATTLDVLSNGRGYLGIGAAWFEKEAKAYGFEFPSLSERFERLYETLEIAHQLWDEDNNKPYLGNHYQLEETLLSPQPISEPHPPILIGGMGETKTLRFVAEHADACNLFIRAGIDTLKHKLEVLKQHCDDVGRSYEKIEKTALGSWGEDQTTEDLIKEIHDLSEIGIDHVIYNMPNIYEISPIEALSEKVIPEITDL